ncbi:MAG: glutathione ABC transporter substrate-binding protein [Dehalococcoidia bacterium]|nr:MAG: glutathione ABC transporter substrate-binding protein [Dehalococcoidia bacterium]
MFRRSLAPSLSSLAALLLAACLPAAPSATPGGVAPAPDPGKPPLAENQRLVFATPSLSTDLDPHLTIGATIRKWDMYETLVLLDEKGTAKPLLATRWELVSPTSWRFTLRQDAKFHDGTPFTSDDVVFSFNRLRKPELKSPVPGTLTSLDQVTAVDRFTVQMTTKYPDPLFVKRMWYVGMVSKAYVERVGDAVMVTTPMGTGPFRLKEFKPDDKLIITAWNEHPYRKPILQEIEFQVVPDANARTQGLRLGAVDYASLVSIETAASLKREGFNLDPASDQIAGVLFDAWGTDGNYGPTSNKLVRQAMNYAVDRETFARTIYHGLAKPVGVHIPEGVIGYNPAVRPFTYDLAKAKQLLAQAGYPNGFEVEMEFWVTGAETQPTALYIQSQLKEIGVNVKLTPIDFPTFRDKIYKQKPIAPMYLGASGTAPMMDADYILVWAWGNNRAYGKRMNNAEFDRLYEAASAEMDAAKREKLLQEAAAVLQDDPSRLLLVSFAPQSAYAKHVGGIERLGEGLPLLDKLYRTK